MTNAILVLNAGSSSIKFALYDPAALTVLGRGSLDGIGGKPRLRASGAVAAAFAARTAPTGPYEDGIAWLLDAVREATPDLRIAAVGHRVVHGGVRFHAPAIVTEAELAELERLVAFAPLHEPFNLAAIRAAMARWPGVAQVACFDTQFHRTQPRLAQIFALPFALTDQGLLKYGFHGLSYEYIASALPGVAGARAEGRVIVAHLGNGASMCGMAQRRSVASTMGFTPLEGLVMGTRCGSIDPGLVLSLAEQRGVRATADLLYHQSGLLGVSGLSGDVRDLEQSVDPRAAEALDLFAYRAGREVGSLVAALGGLDVMVFTGGIGENSATMRAKICGRAAWTGAVLDDVANTKGAGRISAERSAVDVYVIPTDEELVIARSTQALALA